MKRKYCFSKQPGSVPGCCASFCMTGHYEHKKFREGFSLVCGCDEVGRGCLAGPVVAAAVVFGSDRNELRGGLFEEIDDSKKLTAKKREQLAVFIKHWCVAWAVGLVSPKKIDAVNIHRASLQAMGLAVNKIKKIASCENMFVYVDGKFCVPSVTLPQQAVVDGDAKVLSVAAASIVAKTHRDNLMVRLDKRYPQYGFAVHKGYATERHRRAIAADGLTPIHRLSFCGRYL